MRTTLVAIILFAVSLVTASISITYGNQDLLFLDGGNEVMTSSLHPLYGNTSTGAYAFTTDASFSTLRQKDGSVTLFSSVWNGYWKWIGSDVDKDVSSIQHLSSLATQRKLPLAEAFMPSGANLNSFLGRYSLQELSQYPSRFFAWIPNVYQIHDQELLGFIHIENYVPCGSGVIPSNGDLGLTDCENTDIYRIGLAYSNDGGATWKWLGEILRPFYNNGWRSNIGGIPYLVVGDYFYVYFNETTTNWSSHYLSVARAKVTDVINSARLGKATNWVKYSANYTWQENGLTGLGSSIGPASYVAGGGFDAHGDGAYLPELGKYILVLPYWGSPSSNGVYVLSSTDGVQWLENDVKNILPVEQIPNSSNWAYSQYLTIIGKPDGVSSADYHIVGKSFYLLYPDLCSTVNSGILGCTPSVVPSLYRREITLQ